MSGHRPNYVRIRPSLPIPAIPALSLVVVPFKNVFVANI